MELAQGPYLTVRVNTKFYDLLALSDFTITKHHIVSFKIAIVSIDTFIYLSMHSFILLLSNLLWVVVVVFVFFLLCFVFQFSSEYYDSLTITIGFARTILLGYKKIRVCE